jgi:hypothetical protein
VLQAAAPPAIVRLADLFGDSRAAGPGSCFLYQVAGRPVTIPQGCTGQVVLQQVAPEGVFWYDSAQDQAWGLFVVSDRGKPLADCRTPGGPCLFNIPAGAAPAGAADGGLPVTRQVRLIYDANSFTLLNIGGQRLDISGLSFSNGTQTLHASIWNTPSNTASLYSFPAGIASRSAAERPAAAQPTGCKVRHAWVAVRANQTFWTAAPSRCAPPARRSAPARPRRASAWSTCRKREAGDKRQGGKNTLRPEAAQFCCAGPEKSVEAAGVQASDECCRTSWSWHVNLIPVSLCSTPLSHAERGPGGEVVGIAAYRPCSSNLIR